MLRKSLTAAGLLLAACSTRTDEPVASKHAPLTQQHGGEYIEAGDEFGAVLATGRFNNDEFDDLVVGAPGEDGSRGAISIFMGSANGLTTGTVIKQSQVNGADNVAGDRFGAAIAAGDLDGNGYDELVVGVPGEDSRAGAIVVWRSSASGLEPVQDGRIFTSSDLNCGGSEPGDEFGSALAIGDFNRVATGENFEDLAIGAPGEDLAEGDGQLVDAGLVCVVKGRADGGIVNGAGAYYKRDSVQPAEGNVAVEAGGRFGAALAAGRLADKVMSNGVETPGIQDSLVIGAPGAGSGEVLTLFGRGSSGTGPGSFFQTPNAARLTPEDNLLDPGTAPRFGAAVAVARLTSEPSSAGGLSDVIVGAPDATTGKDTGTPGESVPVGPRGGVLFLFPPKSDGTRPGKGHWYQQSGGVAGARTEGGDLFGAALASGDFDGDQKIDLAVGAPGEGPGSLPDQSGIFTLFSGSEAGLEVGAVVTQEDLPGSSESEANDRMGSALATGDFDGNQIMDLAIGAPGEAPGTNPAGGYVFVRMGAHAPLKLTHGPILGAVTDTSIKIWVRANKAASFRVGRTKSGEAESLSAPFNLQKDPINGGRIGGDFTGAIELTGLQPATAYSYRVLLDGATKHSGTFRTLPNSGVIKFAYGADSKLTFRPFVAAEAMEKKLQEPVLLAGQARKQVVPHFAILGGDNIYADQFMSLRNTQAAYDARYRQTFADGPLRSLMQKVPMFMTWDDHEIENNWDDRQKEPYPKARAAYNEYQGSHNPGNNDTVYYSFRASDADFFVLDTRTYRSKGCAKDNEPCTRNNATCVEGTTDLCSAPDCDLCQTMLGKTQRNALLQWLSSAQGSFKFIVSSVPFDDSVIAVEKFDSWRGFMREKEIIFDYIKTNAVGGVVLLSGDQHWVGIFKVDYRKSTGNDAQPYLLYEFSPTPMGTATRDLPTFSPNDEYLKNEQRGFGLFTLDASSPDPTQQKLKFQWIFESGDPDPDPKATKELTRAQISPW